MNITAAERRRIADLVGCNEQFLYQCMTGRNAMQPADAVALERASGGRVRRWHVRQADWHRIWPELIGAEGAPVVPGNADQEVRDAA